MALGRKIVLVFLVVLAGIAVTAVWAQNAPGQVKPYVVASGQMWSNNFTVLYVLDNQNGKLAAIRYDPAADRLNVMGVRDLAKDFASGNSGLYSLTVLQLTNDLGLVYVTDAGANRAIAYKVSQVDNTITPNTPVDLAALFRS